MCVGAYVYTKVQERNGIRCAQPFQVRTLEGQVVAVVNLGREVNKGSFFFKLLNQFISKQK